MAKDIQTGIDATIEVLNRQQKNEFNSGWRDLRNKLDSVLLATNVLKSNDAMRACRVLDGMSTEERQQHILGNWGPAYLERSQPILIQLEQIEKQIEAAKDQDEV